MRNATSFGVTMSKREKQLARKARRTTDRVNARKIRDFLRRGAVVIPVAAIFGK